jgi:ankyrin repeat protein
MKYLYICNVFLIHKTFNKSELINSIINKGDKITKSTSLIRPSILTKAIKFFYLSVSISIISAILNFTRVAEAASEYSSEPATYQNNDLDEKLWDALEKGNNVDVIDLLKSGASPDAARYYLTALMAAVISGNEDIVRMMLSKTKHINAKTPNGQSVLHLAAMAHNLKIINLLLNAGADKSASDNYGFKYDFYDGVQDFRFTEIIDNISYLLPKAEKVVCKPVPYSTFPIGRGVITADPDQAEEDLECEIKAETNKQFRDMIRKQLMDLEGMLNKSALKRITTLMKPQFELYGMTLNLINDSFLLKTN